MKNNSILAALLLLCGFAANAQDSKFKLGIRFAPSIAFNRVTDLDDNDGISYSKNGAGVRFSGGLIGDFYFAKNYAFYTGFWFTATRSGLKYQTNEGSGKSVTTLQYIQLPLAIKLFTSEIATDTKLYFVIGTTVGWKIAEKQKEFESSLSEMKKPERNKAYSNTDFGLLLTAGAEMKMAESTILFGGLSYNRGLNDAASKDGVFVNGRSSSDQYAVNNMLLSLEIGIKF